MLKKETIKLKTVSANLDSGKFVVSIRVENPEDRTLYAYGSARRIVYDNATGKLTLLLHDQYMSPEEDKLISPHLKQPRFVALEGRTETEVRILLEPTITRLRSATERGTGPLFEELRVSEAKEINVEIAHQDTPFYYNPREENAKQLKEWGNIISKASYKINKSKEVRTEHTRKMEKS
jgi:hypothetical protein